MTAARRYWAIRTDRENRALLLDELRKGCLRQGWGHDSSQDLRLIQSEIGKGGAWLKRLSNLQKEVLPHLRMLSSAKDSVQLGDCILVPNLPEQGYFMLAEVDGEYYYDLLKLSHEKDYNDLGWDYGHVLPIRLVTKTGINNGAKHVDAGIRNTLRTPMRMWSLDQYGDAIERLVKECKTGTDLATATSGEARLESAWVAAWSHAAGVLHERLGSELDSNFQAAEWEEPIKTVLAHLYPGADVRWVAGPKEHGADVVIQIPNHFGGLPWLIAVQVKNYAGQIDSAVVEQMRDAYDHYSNEGNVVSLVVMTTADKMTQDCRAAVNALSEKVNVPVHVVLREEMMKIISDGLMRRPR